MKIETLEKGILIKKEIDTCKSHRSEIRKLYAKNKNDDLTEEETQRLFAIATSTNDALEEKYKQQLKNL